MWLKGSKIMTHQLSELAILLHPDDNVAIARQVIPAGTSLADGDQHFSTRKEIPSGHKLARAGLSTGQAVLRYGQVIGFATCDIQPGDWVHSHNLEVGICSGSLMCSARCPILLAEFGCSSQMAQNTQISSFYGFRRGREVGTRNYIAVISTVSCANQSARQIADAFTPERLAEFSDVDGVVAIVHAAGCSSPPDSLSFRYLQRTLLHLAEHPNVGGAIFVSLGCEGNQVQVPTTDFPNPIPASSVLTIQDLGGIRGTVRAGIAAVNELLQQ
jgi:altronate dehydratase